LFRDRVLKGNLVCAPIGGALARLALVVIEINPAVVVVIGYSRLNSGVDLGS
jgi:hypothetical protein